MPPSLFPPNTLEDALLLAKTIMEHNSGKPMRRFTIFNSLNRSPESSSSRQLVTASAGYGLTTGSYKAEFIELTERGRAIVENHDSQAKIDAVFSIEIYRKFFGNYENATLPSNAAASDYLKAHGIPESLVKECLETIIKDGQFAGLIQEISGTKRIVTTGFALEKMNSTTFQGKAGLTKTDDSTADVSTGAPIIPKRIPPIQTEQIPSVHVDVQIHISADATADQIDQIFASMAKHLFGKNS